MSHLQTQFTETRAKGSNLDQGQGGGDVQRSQPSEGGGKAKPLNPDSLNTSTDNVTPKREDVAGPRTPERGGHNREGHQKHNPAEAKGNAGDQYGNDRVKKG